MHPAQEVPVIRQFQETDRFLIGIVAGVGLVVVMAFAAILLRPAPKYVADDEPLGVVQNYLLALAKKDYTRAFSYLSPTLRHPPESADVMGDHVARNSWAFDLEGTTLTVNQVTVTGDRADVTVMQHYENRGFILGGGPADRPFTVRLAREAGGWKLLHSDAYWLECWEQYAGCS